MLASRLAFAAALSLALAASSAAQPAAGQVQIQVWSFGFAPHPIHLAAGRPVTMTFVNRSGSSHDFSAHRFFASSTITAGSAADGEIDLGPHETRTVTLVPRAGVYPVHCSHFFHEQMGMKDQIVVD
jgi:plastocyanin